MDHQLQELLDLGLEAERLAPRVRGFGGGHGATPVARVSDVRPDSVEF
ncbi:MAG TPA: hypothetical protein VJV97_03825 [Gemmatimonadaceae bacterium]|nr:hypothetical protein [Gemmatimonadaceae bacterium]